MDIKNTHELAKIVAICRKNGINYFKDNKNGIEFEFGVGTPKLKRRSKNVEIGEVKSPDLEELTAEQKLFWSSTGIEGTEEQVAV